MTALNKEPMNTLNKDQKSSRLRQRAEESLSERKKTKKEPKSTADIMQLLHELQVYQLELELQNQELQESQTQVENTLAHFTDLYDSAITGYFTFDSKGVIIQTNLMGASFLEMERSKVLGKHFANFIIEDNRSIFIDFLKKVFLTQQKQSCEIAILKKNQENRIVQIDAKMSTHGQECRAMAKDVTEPIQQEKLARLHQLELTQVARSNSMGELASVIAHEINQPLAVIVNYVNGCVRRLESNNYKISEILNVMRLVSKQAELAGKIMHHMKNIARQDETYYKPVLINSIAKAATSQIQKETHYNFSITLALELADNLPLVNVDHIQIELVILNLLRNSLESISKANIDKPKITLRTECQNEMIIVSVTNNGPHYSTEEEAHLFAPSFTTKKTGMGMGLSISRTIIEAHTGRLTSHKMPVFGVCFQFSLPIIQEKHGS